MFNWKSSSWFYPNSTGDLGRDRNARTLQFSCFLLAFAVGAVLIVGAIGREWQETPLLVFAIAGFVAAAVMNRAGRSDWAGRTAFLVVLLGAILLVFQAHDGFRSHSMLVFPGLLLISVMMLDRASYVMTAGIVVVAVAALGIAIKHGLTRATPPVRTTYDSIFYVEMADGFDLTTQLSFSIAAGASKALQLDEARSAAAVEICGDAIPLLVVRTTPISQWKGLNSSQAALASIHGVFLASRGVTGPKYVIEGPNRLAQAVGKSIQVDWDNMKLDCFDRLALKSYNTAIPAQSAVFCTLALHKAHPFDPADIVSIEADVFQDAYDFTGGGRFGPKHDVHTKEDADHSLPYLLAVALLDGDVQTAQLEASRIAKRDVQDLLQKVTVRPNDGFTARYPAELPSRVTVRLQNGGSFTHEISDYAGAPTRPFTWKEIEAKFDKLAAGHATEKSCQKIKNAVRSLEDIQVSDLMTILSELKG